MSQQNKKPICNTGDYFIRVKTNLQYGWLYPKKVVVVSEPGGRYGNIHSHFFFDGNSFRHIGTIPTWASPNGKYKQLFEEINFFRQKYGESPLKTFVKEKYEVEL